MLPEGQPDFPGSAGRLLLAAGALIALAGIALLLFGDRLPRHGRLPGDILIRRPGFTFYFPLGACIVVSLAITAILYLVALLRR